jgi:hypothetical protein
MIRSAWWVVPLVLTSTVHGWLFGRFLPMSEFRDWIRWTPVDWLGMLRLVVLREDSYTRHFSFWTSGTLGAITERDIVLLNTILIAMVIGSGLALYALLRSWRAPRPVASGAFLLWSASMPVLDTLCWQATIVDRLALLFALLGLLAFSLGRTRALSWQNIATTNILVTLPLIAAYNSKEVAWFLLPGLFVIAFLGGTGNFSSGWQQLRLLALPTLYVIFHHARALLDWLANYELHAHSLEGSPGSNISAYLTQLTTLPTLPAQIVVACLLALAVISLACSFRGTDDPLHRSIGVALLLFLGCFLLPQFAIGAVPFRMFEAMAFFACLVALVCWRLCELALRHFGSIAVSVTYGLLLATLSLTVFARAVPHYSEMRTHSDRLRSALPTLRQHIPGDAPSDIIFHVSPVGIRFFEGTPPAIADQLLDSQDPESWSKVRVEARFLTLGPPSPSEGQHTVLFDQNGYLDKIWNGTQLVWSKPDG